MCIFRLSDKICNRFSKIFRTPVPEKDKEQEAEGYPDADAPGDGTSFTEGYPDADAPGDGTSFHEEVSAGRGRVGDHDPAEPVVNKDGNEDRSLFDPDGFVHNHDDPTADPSAFVNSSSAPKREIVPERAVPEKGGKSSGDDSWRLFDPKGFVEGDVTGEKEEGGKSGEKDAMSLEEAAEVGDAHATTSGGSGNVEEAGRAKDV